MRHRTPLVLLPFALLAACDDPPRKDSATPPPSASVAHAAASAKPTHAPATAPAPAPPPPPPGLTREDRAAIVEETAKQVEDRYVTPKVGSAMAAALRDKAAKGGYDAVTSDADLAKQLTLDLAAASHDPHVALEYDPSGRPMSSAEQYGAARDAMNKKEAGFGVGGRLPGNVERVVIDAFEPVDDVRDAIQEHMSHAADADGMLLDLRENTGGDPAAMALVASYLFDGPKRHLEDTWWRSTGATEAVWTVDDPPGKRFGGRKPVVVLTSAKTTGAGEELAYALQATHRATVVGETTAGVAHPIGVAKIGPGLTLRLPIGKVVNAASKKDWDGVGVVPDAATSSGESLKAGYIRVLRAIIAGPGISAATRKGLKAALAGIEGPAAPQ